MAYEKECDEVLNYLRGKRDVSMFQYNFDRSANNPKRVDSLPDAERLTSVIEILVIDDYIEAIIAEHFISGTSNIRLNITKAGSKFSLNSSYWIEKEKREITHTVLKYQVLILIFTVIVGIGTLGCAIASLCIDSIEAKAYLEIQKDNQRLSQEISDLKR